MKTFVMLQNAWSYDGGDSWEYFSWLRALSRCHSGGRLKRLLGDGCYEPKSQFFRFGNTTPTVGDHSGSKLPINDEYVIIQLRTYQPHAVVACGLQAEEAIKKWWCGPFLCMPHPASRVLTNALLDEGRQVLYGRLPYTRRVTLRQQKGGRTIIEEPLQPGWFNEPIVNGGWPLCLPRPSSYSQAR